MQPTTLLTDLQHKFLVQMNSFHQSISNDCKGVYKMDHITNDSIGNQSLEIRYTNDEVFVYSRYGTIKRIK